MSIHEEKDTHLLIEVSLLISYSHINCIVVS